MSTVVGVAALDDRVDRLISAQAARTPKAIAVVCGGSSLTYAELEQRCEGLAARLRSAGARRGQFVGVYLERSIEMLVAVIAVMKTGAAYIPLDPEFPTERLAHMISDSGLGHIISTTTMQPSPPAGGYRRLDLDRLDSDAEPAERGDDGEASDLIYVLYTSGSTGKPKGVALEHRNVMNFLHSMKQEPGLGPQDRLVAVTTLSFDIAGLELYLPLTVGARVIIASRDEATDGQSLRQLLESHAATVMQATPTTWRILIEAGWQGGSGFKALCGGEALPADLARQLLERCGVLWNMYGPTETAIWSTCFRVRDPAAPILIGRPIANTQVYVLDKAGRAVPIGVPGEIYIAGAGVARGYLHRPELTTERFLPDPFWTAHGGRMYRTGDLGRYLADGNLEFRQRADHQVKIRGFRVELGDVESAMDAHPGVKQSVARVFDLKPGDARLIGYIVPSGLSAPTGAELREAMRVHVPQYMIPQHFIVVDALPLTPNGKIDRARLPHPQVAELLAEVFVEPSTATQALVAQTFAEVLGVERVSADASFFDLGGHSVLATRVVSQLRRKLHPATTLRMLFEAATVSALAGAIDALARTTEPTREPAGAHEVFEF